MFFQEVFSSRLRELRKSRGLKQDDVALVLGVTKTQISDIERGKRTTTIEKLIELADYFDVSLDYLVGRSDNPNSHKC